MARSNYNMLVAAVLAIASLSLGVQGQFPYCRCIDRDEVSSPYVVLLDTTSSTADSFTATFTVVNATPPANPTPCYQKILATGSPKIEFDSSYTCLSAGNKPVVLINGVKSQASGIVPPPNYDGKAAIKAKFIPNYMGGPLTITITGYGACANWNTLFNSPALGVFSFAVFSNDAGGTCCPSGTVYAPPPPASQPIQPGLSPLQPSLLDYPPPPPPVGPPFPYCRCDRATVNTPYFTSASDITTKSDDTYNWYTVPISVRPCDGGKCCNIILDKIEISIRDACKASVGNTAYIYTASTGETSARTATITSYGVDRALLKFGRLPWDKSTAGGSTVAFGLLKSGACPTIDDLLPPGAQLAFFNKGNCCPSFPI